MNVDESTGIKTPFVDDEPEEYLKLKEASAFVLESLKSIQSLRLYERPDILAVYAPISE